MTSYIRSGESSNSLSWHSIATSMLVDVKLQIMNEMLSTRIEDTKKSLEAPNTWTSNRLCDCVESPIGTCEEGESLSNFMNMETSWVVTHACFLWRLKKNVVRLCGLFNLVGGPIRRLWCGPLKVSRGA